MGAPASMVRLRGSPRPPAAPLPIGAQPRCRCVIGPKTCGQREFGRLEGGASEHAAEPGRARWPGHRPGRMRYPRIRWPRAESRRPAGFALAAGLFVAAPAGSVGRKGAFRPRKTDPGSLSA